MNGIVYRNRLKQSMIPSLRKLGYRRVFHCANDPKRTSKTNTALMKQLRGWNKPPLPKSLKVTRTNESFASPTISTPPPQEDYFCKLQPLSPADTQEERLLVKSIAWPQTPPLSGSFSLDKSSDPRGSNFVILPKDGGQRWHVGDQIKVWIKMKDFLGNPKKTGGDFMIARLHNPVLRAGVTGKIVDHLNGSYTAVFPLLWNGSAEVEVTLIHTSEAITVLRSIIEHPDRVMFDSQFRRGRTVELSKCNICLPPTKEPICNFTDVKTGDPWFCYKPKKLGCNTRITHYLHKYTPKFGRYVKLFQSGINMKVSIPHSGTASVKVLPPVKGVTKSPNISQPGFYYHGVWRTLSGPPVHRFNTPTAVSQCLQNKQLFLYGDSTVRQWYDYLTSTIKDLKPVNIDGELRVGPFMATDHKRNTTVVYRIHGIPLQHTLPPIRVAKVHYIANELDSLEGGANTVVVIGVWAHFGLFPIRFYVRRMQSIRKAVIRLLDRAPDTMVVIRTSNFRILSPSVAWVNSDFHTMERDKILRAVFKGVNVRWVDALEMTASHYLEQELHPKLPIIKNMINVLLSFICPGRLS
ncbi:NXPE family member 3-like [Neosynchiropus ocellatus]